MSYAIRCKGKQRFILIGAALCLAISHLISPSASAFIYRAPEGSLKDNCVVCRDGKFYLFTMYREEQQIADVLDQWRNVWSATSEDGVHWTDVGPVIKDAPFIIFAMRVWQVGDKYMMNHGSFTGDQQDVLRLWESSDLRNWSYLGPDYDIRRPDGKRLDHMDVITETEDGKTVYYGYAAGGLLRSEDGVKWKWVGDFSFTDNLNVRLVQEPGGCQRIGDLYYLLVGGFYPGNLQYCVATFISEKPTGPFRPDYPAFRLNGYSGREVTALWAGYCRTPNETLLSNYILDPSGNFWWHAPLKSAIVDKDGHLHMGYWKGNEKLKGEELPFDMSLYDPVYQGAGSDFSATSNRVDIKAPLSNSIRWITPGEANGAIAFCEKPQYLNERANNGFIMEGVMRVNALDSICLPAAGIVFEQNEDKEAKALLFETWGQTEFGTLRWKDKLHFDSEDRVSVGCAQPAGIPSNDSCAFRILFRKNIFEIYVNDLLVQTYSIPNFKGRIGFFSQDGDVSFSDIKVWKQSLGN
jgi:hypothetical protein